VENPGASEILLVGFRISLLVERCIEFERVDEDTGSGDTEQMPTFDRIDVPQVIVIKDL